MYHKTSGFCVSERDEPLTDWDYLPPVGPRPLKGFVGLKNAGATCYMNSVLQQLYMVESIRVGLLAAEGAATDLNEDFSGDERPETDVSKPLSLIGVKLIQIILRCTSICKIFFHAHV